ncbi:hypothetical protein ACEQ8H_002844 [Pleosporales sp. CAS-2024a]
MAKSIIKRKRDFVYLVFFITRIVMMLAFDLTPYYPDQIKPRWMTALRAWYIATYADRFFYAPPPWFPVLAFLQLIYHFPLSVWAVGALLQHNPRTPLALLVFGLEGSITALICLLEMLSWEELTDEQRGLGGLGGLYGGYLAFAFLMALDCYARLDGWITRQKQLVPFAKKEL